MHARLAANEAAASAADAAPIMPRPMRSTGEHHVADAEGAAAAAAAAVTKIDEDADGHTSAPRPRRPPHMSQRAKLSHRPRWRYHWPPQPRQT